MLKFPKVVPWASTEEYMAAADCLYSSDISERKRGVAIVKAWRARGRVPVAIEATASLAEMCVADHEQRHGVTICQLQHMYAMALIRFVNSIVDLEQKGVYAQSVAMLAGRIGMPAWFVELRHAGTHEQLPSLATLRSACAQALLWLRDYYWSKQVRRLPADTMIQVRAGIAEYLSASEARQKAVALVASRSAKHSANSSVLAAAETAMESATTALTTLVARLHADAVRLYVVPVLIESGFLVPSEKRLRAKFPDCNLPAALVEAWCAPFAMFTASWGETLFYEELLAAMVSALTPDSSELGIFESGDGALSTSHAATLVAWIRWILESHYVPSGGKASTVSIEDLLEGCLRNPSYYSRSVLRVVSDVDPALKRDLKPFVEYMGKALAALVAEEAKASAPPTNSKPLLTVSLKALQEEEALMQRRLDQLFGAGREASQTESMDVDVSAKPAATATSVPEARSTTTAAMALQTEAAANRWSYVPEAAWTQCPIGTLCDGTVPALEWPVWIDSVPLHATTPL
ncbi:rRNA-processing protein las1 [Coemansia sp. RSA 2671]|nr:rRNA-processing protein las1 [Coemansia sp. RSA 2675]KAJ2025435.1 rRNA-processing protein las1 [Coemansia sp. S610]KAJ2346212.1 rRNA-processing protein las1 [Coemansia sp. RSA 2671]